MKKFTLFFFFLQMTFFVMAQSEPAWVDSDQRRAFYPDGIYFTGYSEGQRVGSESVERATKRIKDAARVEAVSTIQVHVKNSTQNQALSQTLRTMEGTFRQSTRQFASHTQTSVDVEIPGLQVDAWTNPSTGMISAFAYVKKASLIRQLEKKITVLLTKIETTLDQIDQLIANGQKLEARTLAEKTLPQFGEVEQLQKLLVAVDDLADEETLQLELTRSLQHRLTGVIASLQHGLAICLTCTADCFGTPYTALQGEVKGQLSALGCSFVADPSQADYVITVQAKAREYNRADFGGNVAYFAYVDADISLTKTATGQRIYDDFLSIKGGHTHNYSQAARTAYKDLAKEIDKLIKQYIQ